MTGAVHLRLLGRPGCHLCDDMLQVLAPFIASGQVEVQVVDVDDNPALAEQYGMLIPVLLHGKREIACYHLEAEQVKTLLFT